MLLPHHWVVAMRSPVAVLTITTEACAIRPPAESYTLPRIEPLASWAGRRTAAGINNKKRMRAGIEQRVQDMKSPPHA